MSTLTEQVPQQVIIPLCRHVRTTGVRCRSAAVSGQSFCYFHVRLHQDHPAPLKAQQIVNSWKEEHLEAWRRVDQDPMTIARAYPRQNEFNFPALEDAESVQLAGSMLFHAIAQGQIHPIRARILIDALRIVNSSMGRRPAPAPPASTEPAQLVRNIELSSTGIPLALPSTEPITHAE